MLLFKQGFHTYLQSVYSSSKFDFYSVSSILSTLLEKVLNDPSDVEKQAISLEFNDHCSALRKIFLDLFIAINETLYAELLKMIDDVKTSITNSLFDEGVNVSYKPKFEELIENKISRTKTNVLKVIFDYNGN